ARRVGCRCSIMTSSMLLQLLQLQFLIAIVAADKLLHAQIVIRHSDRAPSRMFTSPEAAALFPRGLAEITNAGLRHAYQEGVVYRQRYHELGLLSERKSSNDVYVRSSPVSRVLHSASAFSLAFVDSPLKTTTLPIIHTTATSPDDHVLLTHDSLRFRCEVLRHHNMTVNLLSSNPCDTVPVKAAIVRSYPDCAAYNYSMVEAAIAELADPRVKLDAALEKCARDDGHKVEYRAICSSAGADTDFSLTRLRENVGALMDIVSGNVDDVVKKDTVQSTTVEDIVARMKIGSAPIRIYYTHDYNLLGVAQALGVIGEFRRRNPDFSSALIIETWKTINGYQTRVLMKDGVANPFKSISDFSIHEFKKQIAPYVVSSDEILRNENSVVYSFAQFMRDVGPDLPDNFPISALRDLSFSTKPAAWPLGALMLLAVCSVVLTVFVAVRHRRRESYISMD
ncbi:hypothetical protein PFISCL1PPCAC_4765, partial [Pristionchus fissidentatus]